MSDAWLRALVALPFGLAIGSFMTVVVARVPAGESVVRPRSRCPRCGAEIAQPRQRPRGGVGAAARAVPWRAASAISVSLPALEISHGLRWSCAAMSPTSASGWRVMVAAFLAIMPAISSSTSGTSSSRTDHLPRRSSDSRSTSWWRRLFDGGTDPVGASSALLLYGGSLLVLAFISRGMGMGDAKLGVVIGMVFGALGLRYVGVAVAGAILFGGLGGIVALLIGRDRKSADPFRPVHGGRRRRRRLLGRADRRLVPADVRRRLSSAPSRRSDSTAGQGPRNSSRRGV